MLRCRCCSRSRSKLRTFINDIRTGLCGVPWTPRLVESGAKLQFGKVAMVLTMLENTKTTASARQHHNYAEIGQTNIPDRRRYFFQNVDIESK